MAARAITVDEGASHHAMVFGEQHFRTGADVVITEILATIKVIRIETGVYPYLW